MELLYSGWGDKFGRNPTFYKLDIEFFTFFYSLFFTTSERVINYV